jgi:hypothetical protein
MPDVAQAEIPAEPPPPELAAETDETPTHARVSG